jgi:putative transposase
MRVLPVQQNGPEEDRDEGQEAYAGADRAEVARGDRMLGEGSEVPEVAKALEVSEATYHRWRTQYGGMKADDVKRLKELERENQSLKRIVADKALEIDALKEIAKGNF